MACSDFDDLHEFWAHGQFFDGVNCYYVNQLGEPATQFIVFLTLGLSLLAYTRDPRVMLVPGAIFAAVFIAPLPPAVVTTAVAGGVVITAAVLYLIVHRARSEVLR